MSSLYSSSTSSTSTMSTNNERRYNPGFQMNTFPLNLDLVKFSVRSLPLNPQRQLNVKHILKYWKTSLDKYELYKSNKVPEIS